MSSLRTTLPTMLAGLVLLAACSDDTRSPLEPGDTSPQMNRAGAPLAQVYHRPHEAAARRAAERVPALGGFYFDKDGNLVAFLTDLNQRAAARAVLEPVLRARTASKRQAASGQPTVVFRQADYRFAELTQWRDRMTDPVLNISGVVFTDLDESGNRLKVGVASASAREAARAKLVDLGIPAGAVVIEDTEPIKLAATLQDYNRPIEGGLQIAFPGGSCTLGFNAYWSGYHGFMTNSHCTSSIWSTDYSSIYQPANWSSDYYIGYELNDPYSWDCGSSTRCRYSDAAFIYRDYYTPANQAYIARTTYWAYGRSGTGSLEIDPNNPRMQITGESAFPAVGDYLDKIGRTTGWTYGNVQQTCSDVAMADGRRVLCTDFVNMGVYYGDSGSPVFIWQGNTVTLAGILWGMNSQSALISAMWNIEYDLGDLIVT